MHFYEKREREREREKKQNKVIRNKIAYYYSYQLFSLYNFEYENDTKK